MYTDARNWLRCINSVSTVTNIQTLSKKMFFIRPRNVICFNFQAFVRSLCRQGVPNSSGGRVVDIKTKLLTSRKGTTVTCQPRWNQALRLKKTLQNQWNITLKFIISFPSIVNRHWNYSKVEKSSTNISKQSST